MQNDLSTIQEIQDAIVTVMGLGRYKQGSGVGAAKWLLRHGAQIVITDLKSEKDLKESVDLVTEWYETYRKEYPDRAIYAPVFVLGQHREDDFVNVQLVVKNPDVPKESAYVQKAQEAGVRVESDVSLFWHLYKHPIYGVTGTRGKSTTTALIGAMLKTMHPKAVVAGNITHSPLEELDWLLKESEAVPIILELSSWLLDGLGHVNRGPEIGVLTNVSEDHLDRYGSFDAYVDSKASLFKLQSPEQKAVLNFDHPIVRKIGEERVKSKRYWFSQKPLPAELEGSYIAEDGTLHVRLGGQDREVCHPKNWPSLQGEHNVQNALAGALAAALAGVSDAGICGTLRTFEGLPGRQQTVREFDGVTYVNDTNSTTPEGTMVALKRFRSAEGKHIVLIIGGNGKGIAFDDMAAMVRDTCKHVVYLEGKATDEIEKLIGSSVPASYASNMQEAVEAARKAAMAGDVVLLSPGTTSFAIFKNAYDRGGQFVEAVKNLV